MPYCLVDVRGAFQFGRENLSAIFRPGVLNRFPSYMAGKGADRSKPHRKGVAMVMVLERLQRSSLSDEAVGELVAPYWSRLEVARRESNTRALVELKSELLGLMRDPRTPWPVKREVANDLLPEIRETLGAWSEATAQSQVVKAERMIRHAQLVVGMAADLSFRIGKLQDIIPACAQVVNGLSTKGHIFYVGLVRFYGDEVRRDAALQSLHGEIDGLKATLASFVRRFENGQAAQRHWQENRAERAFQNRKDAGKGGAGQEQPGKKGKKSRR
ncbi:MAG: hypothetical protein PHI63_04860 [Patescibacteria group bacterium]|nr:hypothetical protein [Patescibacteria group bacterium]